MNCPRGAGHFLPVLPRKEGEFKLITEMLGIHNSKFRGSAEGRSPFAEGLGVSPIFLKSPKTGGFRGLMEVGARSPRP